MIFTLEKWNEGHIDSLAKYANNENLAWKLRNSFPYPYTAENAREFIGKCEKKEGKEQISRAIVIDGEAVGCITMKFGQDVFCRSAEIGYWLGEPFWKKGIMTQAVIQLCEEAYMKYKLFRIQAEPAATNIASRKVLEKAGFELEAIRRKSLYMNGCIQDSYLYATVHD